MFNARIMVKCLSCWGCACFKGEVNNKTKQASVWASTINYQSVMGKKEPSPLYHARQIPLKLRSSDMQAGIHSHTHTLLLEKGFLFASTFLFILTWPQKRNAPRKQFSPTIRVCQCFSLYMTLLLLSLWPASTNPNFWAASTKAFCCCCQFPEKRWRQVGIFMSGLCVLIMLGIE
jgi:hypothetical protein